MAVRTWVRKLFARPATRPTRALARRRPHLEMLEDRLAPAAYHVTSLSDDGSAGTLRWAITQANANPGPDTIDFQVSGTISLNGSQLPAFTDAATTAITGPSGGGTLDAGGASRIFQVNAGATASLTGLTLANGQAGGDTGSSLGGGIYNQGTLALADCTLSGNSAIYGGGIDNSGTMSLTNVTLSGNGALDDGGGIDNGGTMSLTNVTLSGNGAQDGGGIWNAGTLSVTNCTLSGNTAFSNPFFGGGNGGGIYNQGTLSVTNCTLSGNTVFSGPFGGGGSGGGIYNAAALALNNSIVANSPDGGDLSGGYSGGHNLFGEVALGPLADNGGPTQTMALPAGSLAINAADPALVPATDQRGFARDALPDIGAFEAGAVPHLLVVTTLADENDGDPAPWRGAGTSLREAIAFANQNPGADSITFAVSGTISLNGSPLPAITDDLTITGPSGGVTLDAGGASRIFQVNAGATASLTGLTLANGQAGGDTGSSLGGGIYNQGTLALADCTLSGNSAIYGGGIDNSGTMSLTNVSLSGNGALDDGGGIDNGGTMSLTNVTLSGNGAQDGGGIWNAGTLSVTNCTLSGNTAFSNPFFGGGNGGGIYNQGTLSVTNCTLSGNTVFSGPFGGGGSGGGIYNAAALALNNSIVANSPDGGDLSGGYSGGHNLFGEVALGPLADNGGPTQTMALPAGSPALDAGDSTAPGLPGADQRGFARLSGAAVDVGAFEVQEPLFNTTALPDGTYGTPYSNTITATATGGAAGPFTFAVTSGTLPPGLSLTTGGALSGTPTAAGSFSFTVTATDSDSDTGSQGYTLTIDKAALTITAANQTRIQGKANPAFTVSYSGFVLGEGPGALGGTLTFSTAAGAGRAPGSYAVTPGGLTSGNYAITFVSGTLTVLGYGQATSNLQAQVDAAGLDHGTQNSLDSQLRAAVALFNAGDTAGGVSQLGAFISHVSAQRGKHIGAALADAWVASAQRIIDAAG